MPSRPPHPARLHRTNAYPRSRAPCGTAGAGRSSLSTTDSGLSPGATATAFGVFSRNAKDWTDRVPLIVEAVRALPVTSATIDGEGVVVDDRG